MPDYIQDPNDPKKQIPGPPTGKHYGRVATPVSCSITKAPNYVYVTAATSLDIGFFFGSSASFAKLCPLGTVLQSSSVYDNFGTFGGPIKLDINPTAFSGSDADVGKVKFVYKGGLDGSGR